MKISHGNNSGKNSAARMSGGNAGIAGGLLLAALLPAAAIANPDDPFTIVAGVSTTHDSNIFRLNDNVPVPVPGKTSRSDTINAVSAGVRFDKPYSMQRVQLEFTGTRYHYQNYDYLNFTGFDYRAGWFWALTPDLTGSFSADRRQSMVNYADFFNPGIRNIQVVENRRAAADWRAGGGWHLLGAVSEMKLRNSTPFLAVGDILQDSVEGGVRYVAPSESALALVQRESWGEYRNRPLDFANRLDTNFKQHETELQGRWVLTGKSTLDGKVAWQKREHENFPERDFSGAVGMLRYLWLPTAKLEVAAQAGREMISFQETNPAYPSSYIVSRYASLAPAWQITEKTSVRLRFLVAKRQYEGAIVPTPIQREDRVKSAQLGATWRLSRSLDVNGTLTHERRTSNIDSLDYKDNVAMLSLALRF